MDEQQFRKIVSTLQALFDPQSSEVDTITDATADSYSAAICVKGTNVSLWAKGTGINTVDATVKLQGCNFESTTNSDWVDLDDSKVTLAADATAYGSPIIGCAYKFVRRKFSKGTNSAGTFKTVININR